MHKIGLSITGIGHCEGFSREYFENCYLGYHEFKEVIPNDILNMIIGLGEGIVLKFLNSKTVSFEPRGFINCEFNGEPLHPNDPIQFVMKLDEEALLELREFQFKMKLFLKKD